MLATIGVASAESDLPSYLQPIHGTKSLSPGFSADGPIEIELPFPGNEPMEDRLRQYDGEIWKCGGDTTVPPTILLSVEDRTSALYFRVFDNKSFVGEVTFGLLKPDESVVCGEGGNYSEPFLMSIETPAPGNYFIWLGNGLFSSDDSTANITISESAIE
ncbi:MAG: hypothetical protein CMK09_03695 [Ponticaulis sp.]|nr:hypothetical protein [Ponticaulis sp.]|tara:strand:+ start:1346 stop:1825 length:480 start_codon:yes stop_codon:yes gene_type:complete